MITGSVADRDGRVQKGDRVLSINGKGLKGVTHREALAILKVNSNSILHTSFEAPFFIVVIVLESESRGLSFSLQLATLTHVFFYHFSS